MSIRRSSHRLLLVILAASLLSVCFLFRIDGAPTTSEVADVLPPPQQFVQRKGESNPKIQTEPHIEPRYGGIPISVWQQRMKDWDPTHASSHQAIDALIEITRDKDAAWFTRRQAALFLGAIGKPARSAIPVLIDALYEGDAASVSWSIKALGQFGPRAASATTSIVAILHDASRTLETRIAAVESLSRIGTQHPPAMQVLIERLRTGSTADSMDERQIRRAVADVMATMGKSAVDVIPVLIQVTRSDDEPLRRKSTYALGQIASSPELVIPALAERLIFDTSDAVRDSAAEAMARLGASALPALKHLLNDEDPEVRWRAAKSIGQIGPPANSLVKSLVSLAKDDATALVRITATEAAWSVNADSKAVTYLAVQLLTNQDRQIRIRAFRLLSTMGNKAHSGLPQLRQMLKDQRPYVRSAAAKTIKAIETAGTD